jgi:hypothetical protein
VTIPLPVAAVFHLCATFRDKISPPLPFDWDYFVANAPRTFEVHEQSWKLKTETATKTTAAMT